MDSSSLENPLLHTVSIIYPGGLPEMSLKLWLIRLFI
jgi:hypothetical protein